MGRPMVSAAQFLLRWRRIASQRAVGLAEISEGLAIEDAALGHLEAEGFVSAVG